MDELLDARRVELIRELDPDGGEGLLARMISAYADQSPRQVAGILDAADDGDLDEVASLAHMLKSASANLGAERLRQRAQRIERAAREKQIGALASDLPGLESDLRSALRALFSLAR